MAENENNDDNPGLLMGEFQRIPDSTGDIPPPSAFRNGVPISVVPDADDATDDSVMRAINDSLPPKETSDEGNIPPKQTVSAEPTPPPPVTPPKTRKTQQRQVAREPKQEALKPEPVVETQVKKFTGKGAINAFKQAVGSALFPVKMYSADTEILFRELTVTDQKNISKIALMNNSRRDVIYKAQCALINKVADEKNFRIEDYTEFDRIVVLLRLYEQNYFKNEVRYTCAKCGKENVYQLDFSKILAKLGDAWSDDKVYTMELPGKSFRITAGWPKVSAISDFYGNYYKTYQNSNENARNTIDQLSNVEYLVMFLKRIDLITNGEEISLDLDDFSYADRTDVVDSLPQGIIFDDDDGVISKIVSDFTDKLNKAFQYEKCMYCGAETEEGIGSVADFT